MTSLLGTARNLRRVNLTVARLGREAWRATVKDQARMTTSETPRQIRSEPLISPEALRMYQAFHRSKATAADLARAEALGDRADECAQCGGSGVVGYRAKAGALMTPAPCDCQPLEDRAVMAGIPLRYQHTTLDNFAALEGKTAALDFARTWKCMRSLVLWGDVGRGKTHIGCGMLLDNLEQGLPARFMSVADLMDELKARFDDGANEQSQAYFERVAREPVLMLDDLGKEQDTPWTRERVSTLIDARYKSERTTIVTTNLTHRDLAERYGRHLGDRLYEWAWLELGGVSMRREQAVSA